MVSTLQCLYQQQLGFAQISTYNECLKRLQCTSKNDFTCIWGHTSMDNEVDGDTPIFACKFATKQGSQQVVALANEDGYLAVYDTKTTVRHVERIHENAIFDLTWLADSIKVVTVSGDHTARLVDIESNMNTEQIFTGHSRSVKTIAASDCDPSMFATGGRDGSIHIWDIRSKVATNMLILPDRIIRNTHCRMTPTSGSKRRSSLNSSAITAANSVTSLIFQNQTSLISCGSGDGLIKIWDLRKTYTNCKPLPCYEIPYSGSTTRNGFSNLNIDRARNRLYVNCLDNTIYSYNIATYNPQPVMEYRGHMNSTFYVKSALSCDGNYLLSGSSDHNAYIWNIQNALPLAKLQGHTAEVTCVAWRQEGEPALITCSDDVKHKLWRLGSETLPDNWEIVGRGSAEMVVAYKTPRKSLKRRAEANENTPVQAKILKSESAKRPLDTQDLPAAKRINSGRRLFPLLDTNETYLKKECDNELAAIIEEDETIFKTPKASTSQKRRLEGSPEEAFSPTTNLPNFVIDGNAPHLHFSPQKRMDKDWLTKMRVERSLVQEMQNLASGSASSPKTPRLEEHSPRHRTPRRRGVRSASQEQSPILKFFRVTNSNILNNSQCSTKSPIVTARNSPLRTVE